jgi:Helicase associated domain
LDVVLQTLDLLPSLPPPPPPPPLSPTTSNGSLQDESNQTLPTGGGPSKTNQRQRHARSWAAKFEQICEFKKTHGHCLVLFSHSEMGPWVSDQRIQYKLVEAGQPSQLTAERIASLNGIGFTWGQSPDAKWRVRYESLLQYRTTRGHGRMPYNYPTVPGLGNWVAEQHHDYKHMQAGQRTAMNDTRIKLLEHAGIVWLCNDVIEMC